MTRAELAQSIRARKARTERVISYLRDPAKVARDVNQAIAKTSAIPDLMARRFETNGASGGESWGPLAESTQRQRARQGFGASGPILVRSGMLKAGATTGKVIADEETVQMQFKDGPAPRYIGKGRAVKQRSTASAAGGRLSDYWGALNEARPFMQPPTEEELRPIKAMRDKMLALILKAIADGKSPREAVALAANGI